MIYLVGGPPRVGKTKLVEEVLRLHPMHAVSSDAIRYMLRRMVPKDQLPPELFLSPEEYIRTGALEAILEDQNAESRALWPYLEILLKSYDEDGYDVLLEGVAVLPELVQALQLPHRAVIVGNTDETHFKVVAEHAKDNPKDWLNIHSDADIETYTKFFQAMDEWLQTEAAQYDVPYIQLRDDTFQQDLQSAAQKLLGRN